ncbi:LamG-like jellyroll fold domain-containing protein [Cognataquiflexum aquatile]|uniref:LamG-like jellyroll fold domain-containing protein n=1 Tax=Cognataquiflexum aquatile TaxID=2249427 RepID=UPI000DEAC8DB|nr:LamG-like jellyroll fold domain-containing protein [Cognataquiflexum aquatile]
MNTHFLLSPAKKRFLFLLLFTFSFQFLLAQSVQFDITTLNFNGYAAPTQGTALKFGPDNRLYLSQLNGLIRIYTVENSGVNSYRVIGLETISLIRSIPNHDDTGTRAWDGRANRQITGIEIVGTAANPIIYVGSSDPIWGGPVGDKVLDTNSGIISKLTWTGSAWDVVDLVRGLPRSEENHSTNAVKFTLVNNKPYLLVASGGFTNAGSPSTNFTWISEYALSAAILSVNLEAIEAIPTQIDPISGRKFKYDIPTLDDPSRANVNGIYNPNQPGYDGKDVGDPFGGNDGLNMGTLVEGGPVQIFTPGYRNAYDFVVTENGSVFVTDNGANANWGGLPQNEGIASTVTNNYLAGEPGGNSTLRSASNEYVTNRDRLLLITKDIHNYQPGSFYGGHPTPVRANPGVPYTAGSPFPFNPGGAGLYTKSIGDFYKPLSNFNPLYTQNEIFRTQILEPIAPGQPGFDTYAQNSLPVNWPPVPLNMSDPNQADYRDAFLGNFNGPPLEIVTTWKTNSNGLDEYKASNFNGVLKGSIIAGRNSGFLHLVRLNPDGTLLSLNEDRWNLNGGNALGINCQGDEDIFPGTIWVATFNSIVHILTPSNNPFCPPPGDPFFDSNADYDNDGFSNQDEIDNGTEYCSGASRPNDLDGDFVSDLNDVDDDGDGISDASDPLQLGKPTNLPINNELFSDKTDELGRPFGYRGLGFTGLMNNGSPNPNWMNWLDRLNEGPLPNDIYGGAAGAIQVAMTGGTANGLSNNQEKGFQFGVNVGTETGNFLITGGLLGFQGPQMFYDIDHNGEVGIQMGDGTQSNFLKLVFTKTGIIAALEIDDIPDPSPLILPLAVEDRPLSSETVAFIFNVNPSLGTVEPQVKIGERGTINLGSITLSGKVLEAVQDITKPLSIGVFGSSADPAKEFLTVYDNFKVDGEQPYTIGQIPNIQRQVSSPPREIDLSEFFGDNFGIENLSFSYSSTILSLTGVSIVGNMLTLTFPNTPYTGLINIRATDSFGYFVEQSFEISVVRANRILYRINAGGQEVIGENNAPNWVPNDQNGVFNGIGYSVNGGTVSTSSFQFGSKHSSVPSYISESTFNSVFGSQRQKTDTGNMRFNIPLPNGVYIINFYVGENGAGTVNINERKFDIRLEGATVRSNLDLVQKYGLGVAAVEQFETSVSDGQLNIEFVKRTGNPTINGIEIIGTTLSAPIVFTNPIPNQVNIVNEKLDGNLLCSATGGVGTLLYSATNLPPGIDIEPVNGRLYGTVSPAAQANQTYNVTIWVTDSNSPVPNQEFTTFTWTILPFDVWTPANENQNYTARHENSFVQAGESFYVMGGRENANTIDVYNYKENTWRALSNVAPLAFNHFQAIEYKGMIWVIGAFQTNSFPNETPASHIWIFDPVKEQYMQGPEIPLARRRGSAGLVLHDDKFYVIGGNRLGHNGQHVAFFDQFDPATGVWTILQDAPRSRDHFSAAMIGNKTYVASGRRSGYTNGVFTFGPVIPEVDVFDFDTNSWSTLPSALNIPTPRAAAVVVNIGNKLLVAGGEVPNDPDGTVRSQALAITEILDPEGQTWTTGSNLNFRRHGTQGIVSGNGVWVAGGSPNRGGGTQRNMEYYGENNPTGTPITESNLTGPSNLVLDIDKRSLVTLQVSGGNQGVFVRRIFLSGLDANDFTFVSGNLSNSILQANSSHVVELLYTGQKSVPTVTLTVEFGLNSSLQIPTNTVSVTGISVSPTTASIQAGSTQQLSATILPSNSTNKTVVWTTSNANVATVNSSGLVSGVAAGTVTITARSEDGNLTATASVTITQNTPNLSITSFVLINAGNNSELQTLINGTLLLSSQVGNLSLAIRVNTNPTTVGSVFFSLSGPINATRTENGAPYALFGDTNGIFSGRTMPNGNYTLSATAYSGTNRTGTVGPTTTIQFSIVSSASTPVSGVSVTPNLASIQAGRTQQLTATVSPANASNTLVNWSTSNPLVATVNSSGLVTALAVGTANINATTVEGSFTSGSSITVTPSGNPIAGLAGHWKLDEGSGNILIDHSGNNNNAELQNTSSVSWIPGVEGLGLVLPATTNRFAIAPHSSSLNITGAITISAWIRPNQSGNRKVLSKSGPDGYEFGINSGGKVEFRFNGNSSGNTYRLESITSYPTNGTTWMHIAATFNGTTSAIYINGQLDATANYAPITIGANTAGLQIGAYLGIHRWNGALDDIRLYGRALTLTEVQTVYSGEVAVPQVPSVPSLLSPSNGQTGVQTAPIFSWVQSQGAVSYTLQVANNSLFNTPVANVSGITQTSTSVSGLSGNTLHYWRVRATNVTGNSEWSAVRSFTTASIPPIGSGLAGHWKLDEGSGNTLIDHSGNGNNAVLKRTNEVSWVAGIEGLGLVLPATVDRFAIAPHSSSLNITEAITISAWIRPNQSGNRKVLSKSGPDGYEFGINSGGKVEFRFNGNSSGNTYRLESITSYPTNGTTWMHIAATFNGTTSRIYINGQLDSSASYAPVAIGANTVGLQIGAYLGIHRWNGALDDIRLYGRALSGSEILNLINAGGAFRTMESQTQKGGSSNPEENTSATEKDLKESDFPRVTRMYPNPVIDKITLELSGMEEERVQISIFDMKGIQLLNQEFNSENGILVMDISRLRLKPGTHVLLVNTNGRQEVFKFQKW